MLAHNARQVQIGWQQLHAQFLLGLAARAGIRRFAFVRVQFPAARAPKTEIRLLRALEQQHFIAFVEAIKQSGDFVGQGHQFMSAAIEKWRRAVGKWIR